MGNCQCTTKASDPRWQKLDEILAEWRDKPGNVIPVLHKAQELFRLLAQGSAGVCGSGTPECR